MRTNTDAVASAITSLMDVVEELCQGLAWGQRPEKDWAEQVTQTFDEHRGELRALGLPAAK